MGWLSKVLGIDKKREAAQRNYDSAAAAAERARKEASDQAAMTSAKEDAHRESLRNIAENGKRISDANNATAGQRASSNVVAGGVAGLIQGAVSNLKKKKAASLSNSLGINI
jgi:hypothetical protein